MIKLDYIYGNEANRTVFYCMPKILFVDDTFRLISTDCKVLYSLMLDRSGLSVRNGWTDDNARVYIYFTLEDAMKFLRVGHTKAGELYKELENHGMIERKKQGLRKPDRIYVKNFVTYEETTAESFSAIQTDESGAISDTDFDFDMDAAPLFRKNSADAMSIRETEPEIPSVSVGGGNVVTEAVCQSENTTENSRDSDFYTPPLFYETPSRTDREIPDRNFSVNQNSGNRKSRVPESGCLDFRIPVSNQTDKKKINFIENQSFYPPTPFHDGETVTFVEKDGDGITEREIYTEMIRENIDYNLLSEDHPFDMELIDGYINLMVDACCSRKKSIRINREEYPIEVVKGCFEKLNREHILYVMETMRNNTTRIRNIRAYTLSVLFNAYYGQKK